MTAFVPRYSGVIGVPWICAGPSEGTASRAAAGKMTKGQITRFERLRRQGRIQVPERSRASTSETTIGTDIIFQADSTVELEDVR